MHVVEHGGGSGAIWMDPAAVRMMLQRYDTLADELDTLAAQQAQALEAAASGDGEGFLSGGIDTGHTSVQQIHTAAANLRQLVQNVDLTVQQFEQVDTAFLLALGLPGSAPGLQTLSLGPIAAMVGMDEQALAMLAYRLGEQGLSPAEINRLIAAKLLRPAGPRIPADSPAFPGGRVFAPDGSLLRVDITVDQFEQMSGADRVRWVEAFSDEFGHGDWFDNIIDIIVYFEESPTLRGLAPGSWASWADAGVLEAIQNGQVLHLGGVPVSPSGGAAAKWRDFFDAKDRGLPDNELISLWGEAEQAGVNYGSVIADDPARGGRPGGREGQLIANFIAAGNLYRLLARLPDGGQAFGELAGGRYSGAIGADIGGRMGAYLDWIVDRGDYLPPFVEPVGRWVGSTVASNVGPLVGAPIGEWFVDPRVKVPFSARGPTYYSAWTAEELTRNPWLPFPPRVPGPMGPSFPPVPPVGIPGVTVGPSGELSLPSGVLIEDDGQVRILGRGITITLDGEVRTPTGVYMLEDVVFQPDGTLLLPDGTQVRVAP